MAGRLAARRDRLPAGVLLPEEVLTLDELELELEPGLADAGLTVAEEPVAAHGGVRSAGSVS